MRDTIDAEQDRLGSPALPAKSSAPGARNIAEDPSREHSEPPAEADALREDIERTRTRMSDTLDLIENRIVRRRDEVWSKATLQHVRETVGSDPWRKLLIAFAAGYVLAALRD